MKIREIITEAVDYTSMFNPIFQALDGDNLAEVQKEVQNDIKQAKAKLANLRPNQNWLLFYLKHYRAILAEDIEHGLKLAEMTPENQAKIRKLQKVNFENMKLQRVGASYLLDILAHFTSYDFIPIKTYNPTNKTWGVVAKDLAQLEEEYFEQVGDDARFVPLQEGDKIIKEFDGGLVWMMLHRGACRDEADAMGHCGNVPSQQSGDRIISFRKKRAVGKETYYEPYLTFIFNEQTGKLGEMKGRANEKPADKYHPYIMWLITQEWMKGFGNGGYQPENNFSMDDLTEEQRQQSMAKNPFLALMLGAILSKIPEEVRAVIDLPETPVKNMMWYERDRNRIYLKVYAEYVIDNHLLEYIRDPDKHFFESGESGKDELNGMLSDLNDNNIKKLYGWYTEIINEVDGLPENDIIPIEEFHKHVSRERFFDIFEEYIDENEEEIDFESESDKYVDLIHELRSIYHSASESSYTDAVTKAAYDALKEFELHITETSYVEFSPVGTMANRENDLYNFLTSDVDYVVYETDQYITDIDDLTYDLREYLPRPIDIDSRYIDTSMDRETINHMFSDYL